MSKTSSKSPQGYNLSDLEFICKICKGRYNKTKVENHRQFHKKKGDKLGEHENIIQPTARRARHRKKGGGVVPIRKTFGFNEFPRRRSTTSAHAKSTALATKVGRMESSIRNLTRENVEQKEQISALVTEQTRQQAEINAIQQRERERVKMIEKLNVEIAQLKAQQSEPTTNPGGNEREIQETVSPQQVKKRGKAAAPKSAPAPTTRPRTRASRKSGFPNGI